MNEFKRIPILPTSNIKFLGAAPYGPQRNNRRIISTTLPLYIEGATPPAPDPGHTPSYIGGALKRMGFEPPPVSRKIKREFVKFVKRWVKKNLIPLTDTDIPTVQGWLAGTDYTEARKEELLREWKKYDKMPRRKVLRKVKSFIKDERYPEPKYPRLINSRVDVAKCLFGPLCWAVSKRLFALPQFIKNTPVSQRPRVLREFLFKDGEEMDATDYTSFEAHFKKDRMLSTTKILFDHMTSKCGSYIRQVSDIMFDTLTGMNLVVNKIVSFLIQAKRCSGEMDTSLSNGFCNSMNIEFLAWKKRCTVIYFVEGDDGIARFSPHHRAPTKDDFKDLGFVIKVVRSRDMADLSFCGQVYDIDECVVVTDIKEQLARFGWTNQRYVQASHKTKMQLLRAKGYSLAYQYNGCPILGKLGLRLLELTAEHEIEKRIISNYDSYHKKELIAAINHPPPPRETGVGTRLLVERLYGISVRQQIELEEQISTWDLGPKKVDIPMPKAWTEFYDTYTSEVPDKNPVWLLQPEKPFVDYISQFNNVAEVTKAG